MILSVSRRTDIPAFFSDWFMNNLKNHTFYLPNPYNDKLISKLEFKKEDLDMIIFWTKDAINFMSHLDYLLDNNYPFYFHYTLTPYFDDLEPLKHSKEQIINNVIELSQKIGKERVILRYDPILLFDKYDLNYHKKAFKRLVARLDGYVDKIILGFLNTYDHQKDYHQQIKISTLTHQQQNEIVEYYATVIKKTSIELEVCSSANDFSNYGVAKAACIDYKLIERLTKKKFKKMIFDKTREHCLCYKCIDIGVYQTCLNGCLYCYANDNTKKLKQTKQDDSLLVGTLDNKEIKIRKDVCSFFENQEQLSFDL